MFKGEAESRGPYLFHFEDEQIRYSTEVPFNRRRSGSSDSFQDVGCGLNWSFNMILLLFSAGFVGFILFKAIPGYSFFSIHPITMTLGYGFIMFQAIRVFSSQPAIGARNRSSTINLHAILQGLVLLLSAIGFGVIYYNKNQLGKNHFTTWHSWIGLLTVIFSGFIAIGGICAKYANAFKKYQRPVVLKSVHAFGGAAIFILACVSLVTGLNTNYFTKLNKDSLPIWQLAYAVPPIMALVALLQVIKSYLPRLKTK